MATTALYVPGGDQARSDARQRASHAEGGLIKTWRYTTDVIGTATTTAWNFTNVHGWHWNQVKIHQIRVQASTSTDFDLLLFGQDTLLTNEHYYKNENNNLVMNDKPIGGLFYSDLDLTGEFHVRLINTDTTNVSTFDIFVDLSPLV